MTETYNADDLELIQDVGLAFDCHNCEEGTVDLAYGLCVICNAKYDIEVTAGLVEVNDE